MSCRLVLRPFRAWERSQATQGVALGYLLAPFQGWRNIETLLTVSAACHVSFVTFFKAGENRDTFNNPRSPEGRQAAPAGPEKHRDTFNREGSQRIEPQLIHLA